MARVKSTSQEEIYKNANILGSRLAGLRKEKRLDRQELAEKLQEYLGQDEAMRATTIYTYESGQRLPTLVTLIAFARVLGCSADYLLGLDQIHTLEERKKSEATATDLTIMPEYDLIIRSKDYEKYDRQAVFVATKNNTPPFISKWGILEYATNKIIFGYNEEIEITDNLILYRAKPITAQFYEQCDMYALTYASLLNAKMVWVEPITTDREVRGVYRGYYTHNSTKTMLTNVQNAVTLPYSGLNIGYNAFSVGEIKD